MKDDSSTFPQVPVTIQKLCSAVLISLLMFLLLLIFDHSQFIRFGIPVLTIILLVYVVSCLLLLIKGFIPLRHLTTSRPYSRNARIS